jgi:hypothetical protein
MSNYSGSNGNWDRWLAVEIGSVKASIQALHYRIEDNRQAAFRDLWHVRRELRGQIAHTAQWRHQWMKHVPWLKIAALFILAILVVTGHVSGAELKQWLMRKITEF